MYYTEQPSHELNRTTKRNTTLTFPLAREIKNFPIPKPIDI